MTIDDSVAAERLDVRGLRKPDKHPAIFAAYAALAPGGSFVLVNDHDPKHLRQEFEVEHPGSHGWDYLNQEPRDWQVRISKLSTTSLPRVLVNTVDLTHDTSTELDGVAWKLEMRERDLDSNVIALPPDGTVDAHAGPDLDVLVHVLAGSGELTTELGVVTLSPGDLLFLPRRSRRAFTAGGDGLRYLTVHQRRQSLVIGMRPPDSEPASAEGTP